MGFKDIIKALPVGAHYGAKQRSSRYNLSGINMAPQRARSGVSVDYPAAQSIPAYLQGVTLISDAIANCGMQVMVQRLGSDKVEEDLEHPISRMIMRGPNPLMSMETFLKTIVHHLLYRGFAYAFVEYNAQGQPMTLYPGNPDKLNGIYTKNRPYDRDLELNTKTVGELIFEIEEYGVQRRFSDAEILYFVGESYDGVTGISPIKAAADALGLVIGATRYGATTFSDDSTPRGVITIKDSASNMVTLRNTDGSVMKDADGKPMQKAVGELIRDGWNQAHGPRGHKGVAVLDNDASYENIHMTPEDRQFLATRTEGVRDVARILNIPSTMLQDTDASTFNNRTTDKLTFVYETVTPWAKKIAATITRKLIAYTGRNNTFVQFNTESLINESAFDLARTDNLLVNSGILSVNEAREKRGLDPVPGGEVPFMKALAAQNSPKGNGGNNEGTGNQNN